MADRKMPHRIATVRLEPETFGNLTGEQITNHVLAAGGNGDIARLERREPIGVDVRKYARRGTELQQSDILTLRDRSGELRLHLDNVGIGEPPDQIDVVYC